MILFLSSCLKQSIADAMIANQNSETQAGAATMTYMINGNTVTNIVTDPDSQSPNAYQLGCSKIYYPGASNPLYNIDCISTSGEMTFTFGTDSLTIGHYYYLGAWGVDLFVTSYNGEDEFVHDPQDSIIFNITSYSHGHISGNFSGRLTPMITAGNPNNIYGTPGSVLITKGSFKNVPVFY